jgi:glutathione peroxidase
MKCQRLWIAAFLSLALGVASSAGASESCAPLLNFSAKTIDGREIIDFCKSYRNQVVLVVNTASQCGYTGQLKGLESLYQAYRGQGFMVLGFPSNDFRQEHDNASETERVARKEYGATFPLFERSAVSGDAASPFFQALAKESGVTPQWNFQKYLIGRNGKIIKVYPSNVGPDDPLFRIALEAALAEKP